MVGFVSMLAQRSPLLFRSGGFGNGSGVAVTSNAIANVFNRSQQPFPSHGVGVVVGNNVKNQQQLRGMASKKHKAILRLSKGYRGRANRCYRTAIARVEKAWQYAYRDRKQKKRDFRRLWIQRVNAGVRQHGLSYSGFIRDLNASEVDLDRKILANLAGQEPFSFKAVVDVVKMRTAK